MNLNFKTLCIIISLLKCYPMHNLSIIQGQELLNEYTVSKREDSKSRLWGYVGSIIDDPRLEKVDSSY